jgi:hypothetical protein
LAKGLLADEVFGFTRIIPKHLLTKLVYANIFRTSFAAYTVGLLIGGFMPVATNVTTCPLCGGSVGDGDQACPHCLAAPQWQDYARAILFARDEFSGWQKRGFISDGLWQAKDGQLAGELQLAAAAAAAREGRAFPPDAGLESPSTCWRYKRPIAGFYSFCNTCGAPLEQAADTLRYLGFLSKLIANTEAREFTLAELQACSDDVQGHITALRAELESGRLSEDALAVARLSHLRNIKSAEGGNGDQTKESVDAEVPQAASVDQSASPAIEEVELIAHRSILEIVLDPHSIQWLLGSGGVLLVVGLVIWLASLGVFKDPLVVAACMGAGTLGVLAGGCAIVKRTRYELAGRALTLLACMVMPLNLWFYHAHHLLTLDGHLWIAALVCCALYAASAAVLEDPVFVYVLAGGVAMTGLLILGDLHRLMEIAAPSTLLIVLGLVALHVERSFSVSDSPFSRKRFGMACFWSAQALIGAGLLLLLGAQIIGWLPITMPWLAGRPMIISEPSQRFLAVGLVLAGAYAYLYSDLVIRRVGVYVYFAAFALLWAEFLVIDLAKLVNYPSVLIGALALTSLVANIAQAIVLGRGKLSELPKLARPLPVLGILLSAAPVLAGLLLHVRAVNADVHHVWPFAVSWAYVAAMALTAICCRISAYLVERRLPRLASAYHVGTTAMTLVGAAGLLSMLGVEAWPAQVSVLMVIPILYLLASRLYAGRPGQRSLRDMAHVAAGALLLSVLSAVLRSVEPVVHTQLLLALFCAEATVFYIAAAIFYGETFNVYLATAMACGATWELLNYWSYPVESYCVTFAVLGIVMLIIYRMVTWERLARPALELAAFRCTNALMSLSFVATALVAMSRLAIGHTDWTLVILLAVFCGLGLLAAGLVQLANFRRWYVTIAVAEAALAFIVMQQQVHLSPWENVEMFCVGVGLLMLAGGYTLWYREQDRHSDVASFCLLFGSLLAGVPLAMAAIINRFGFQISLVDEIGLATVSVLMFITGFMCRLRSTTLVGGGLLILHLAMLLVFVGVEAQLAVGVYLTLGGVALFGLGLFLSMHRERLLALPQRIKEREGLFRVLAWR